MLGILWYELDPLNYHLYLQCFVQEPAHYLFTIEGHVLDAKYSKAIPFSSLFRKIVIQVDRKGKVESTDKFEWPVSSEKHTLDITTFQAKIPNSDNYKPFTIKIILYRKFFNLAPRYEVSNNFLAIFPNVLFGQNKTVSEEEVLFQCWYYIHKHKLLEGRDIRKMVKCDQVPYDYSSSFNL